MLSTQSAHNNIWHVTRDLNLWNELVTESSQSTPAGIGLLYIVGIKICLLNEWI